MPVVGTNDDLRQASAPVGEHGWSCRTGGVGRQNVLRTVPVAALAEVSAFGSLKDRVILSFIGSKGVRDLRQ